MKKQKKSGPSRKSCLPLYPLAPYPCLQQHPVIVDLEFFNKLFNGHFFPLSASYIHLDLSSLHEDRPISVLQSLSLIHI